MNKLTSKQKGFTIIEVVLVLAIAGLIFLVVFLALPALQRSQRDSQRRSDMGRVLSAVQTFQANNQGKVPAQNSGTLAAQTTSLGTFLTSYLRVGDDTFADPNGNNYSFVAKAVGTGDTSEPTADEIWYYLSAKCNGEGAVPATGSMKVAVRVNLETGGAYCISN